jgi:hypothetical protein
VIGARVRGVRAGIAARRPEAVLARRGMTVGVSHRPGVAMRIADLRLRDGVVMTRPGLVACRCW